MRCGALGGGVQPRSRRVPRPSDDDNNNIGARCAHILYYYCARYVARWSYLFRFEFFFWFVGFSNCGQSRARVEIHPERTTLGRYYIMSKGDGPWITVNLYMIRCKIKITYLIYFEVNIIDVNTKTWYYTLLYVSRNIIYTYISHLHNVIWIIIFSWSNVV